MIEEPDLLQDQRFQQREWRVQRFGWIALALLIALAALGLFGNGPLSSTAATSADLTVGYQRFARNQGQQTLLVAVQPGHQREGRVDVLLSRSLLDAVELQQIFPEPSGTTTQPAHLVLAFDVAEPSATLEVRLQLRGDAVGPVRGEVALTDGTRVPVRQFLYP